MTWRKRARANDESDDDGAVAEKNGRRCGKRARFAMGDGDCRGEIKRVLEARRLRRRILPNTADAKDAARTVDVAMAVEETSRPLRGVEGFGTTDARAVDDRGKKEKDDDDLVIHWLGTSRRQSRSAQAAVKGWMDVNGLRPTRYVRMKMRSKQTENPGLTWATAHTGRGSQGGT